MEKQTQLSQLNRFQSGDANTAFGQLAPAEILTTFGPPQYLLSSSKKTEKCLSVGVRARVLYMTPGIFCNDATAGCLAACLGHSSGMMQMPTHAAARDRRTALYLENPARFIRRLLEELDGLRDDAARKDLIPAARLNGSSDLPWEQLHPNLFESFPLFFDYTKNVSRMERFLLQGSWPENYHLTFSAAPGNHDHARRFLERGGNVAVVFWPEIPTTYWGVPVLDGDTHDARFLDPSGNIIGLRAKGLARVDLHGFTVRVCPHCGPTAPEPKLRFASGDTHLVTAHECDGCGFFLRERFLRRRPARPRCRPRRCSGVSAHYQPKPCRTAP